VGPALVAFCLLSGDLGARAGVVGELGSAEAPIGPGYVPGVFAYQASLASEARAGETPLVPGAIPQAFAAEILTPRLDIELRNPGLIFAAWYGPRIFWQDPNPSTSSEPLVLHAFGLTLDSRPSRDVALTAAAEGSIGQPDYTALSQALGPVQGTLPVVSEVATVDGHARIVDKLTDRWQVSLGALVSHWQWEDVEGTSVPGAITGQTTVIGEPAATFRLTPRDALELGAPVGWFWYSNGTGAFSVAPAVTWRRRLDRRTDLNLRLGLSYAHLLGSSPPGSIPLQGTNETSAVSPIGSAELLLHFAQRDELALLGRAFAGVDFYLDPVLGTGVTRGSAAVELIVVQVPSWMTTLRGEFATALQSVPALPGEIPPVPPDETAFSISLNVRRRVTENFYAELGGRWADRGPTLDTPDFHFHQRQLWVDLSLVGTTRPIPRPALPRE
jgi:hypothetical protein